MRKGLTGKDIDALLEAVRATPEAQIHLLNKVDNITRISKALGQLENTCVRENDTTRWVNSNKDWRIMPEETYTGGVTFVNPLQHMKAWVKWDGCTHVWLHEDEEEECYHHLCDIGEYLTTMQTLRDKALAYFGTDEFCIGTLTDEQRLQQIATIQQKEQEETDAAQEAFNAEVERKRQEQGEMV